MAPSRLDAVYRKTGKGQEAIAQRAHGVVGRARSLLILVDGQRPQSALEQLAAGLGDVAQMLAQLEADGLITTRATGAVPTQPAPLAPEPQRATAPTPSGGVPLPQAKAFASRQLMQILGPTSEALCLRVEAARNRDEFIESIRRAYAVVAEVRGRTQADAFGAMIEANLPPA
ncbi:MAG: hypothetical protein KA164_12080 [Rhodoferax sp.]|nr:hypothetical protein [Rhodoferax sp.]